MTVTTTLFAPGFPESVAGCGCEATAVSAFRASRARRSFTLTFRCRISIFTRWWRQSLLMVAAAPSFSLRTLWSGAAVSAEAVADELLLYHPPEPNHRHARQNCHGYRADKDGFATSTSILTQRKKRGSKRSLDFRLRFRLRLLRRREFIGLGNVVGRKRNTGRDVSSRRQTFEHHLRPGLIDRTILSVSALNSNCAFGSVSA